MSTWDTLKWYAWWAVAFAVAVPYAFACWVFYSVKYALLRPTV